MFYFRQPVPEQAAAGREVDVQDSGAGTVTDALHILQTTSMTHFGKLVYYFYITKSYSTVTDTPIVQMTYWWTIIIIV